MKPAPSRLAMEARRLAGAQMLREGVKQADVARHLGVSKYAVSHWAKLVHLNPQALLRRKPTGRPRRVTAAELVRIFGQRDSWTGPAFGAAIREATGVAHEANHIYRLLQKLRKGVLR